MNAWLWLLLAGGAEVASVPLLKASRGFRRVGFGAAAVAALVLSFYGLSRSLIDIPVGTAYAVWTGIGCCGAIVWGIALYKEPATLPRLLFAAMIVTGILGLKYGG
ncbi:multidrug efflux SMR transporter [Saccharibacillus sp. CPCC 101409]|uniref:DMT family transporter n=1 Tax=Saccharibacillus sp. CPCC 101409 TaxID=3058041 RepID=UPI002672472A|nr:multidrug efflux SMR transporter [Saccharibacillus sp. CPCC 101409]MDO3410188.1 multidrug efflux SMR transporter [Saccharibacillus sp. CPCC 101409]